MDVSLLLLIIGFLLVAFLIFKLIKKLIFAIMTFIFFLFVVIGGVFGLIYLDYNYITSQDNIDLKIIYSVNDSYEFGTLIPIEEQELNLDDVKGLTKNQLNELENKKISRKDSIIIISINEKLFKKILTKDFYDLDDINSPELENMDLSLNKNDILNILNSSDSFNEFLDIIFTKNQISTVERNLIEPILSTYIENELDKNDFEMRNIIFLYIFSQSIEDTNNIFTLLKGFKSGDLEIKPDRFTLKILRLLPVGMIKNFIPIDIDE